MPELNRDNLADEFDIEQDDIPIEAFRDVLNRAKEVEDPNNVLTTLINKAGRILDIVEHEMVNGNASGKMAESASQIINSLITAANSIAANNSLYLNDEIRNIQVKQNERRLDQRDREMEIKELYYKGQQKQLNDNNESTKQQNVIITSREDIMKFLENKQTKEIGEDNEPN